MANSVFFFSIFYGDVVSQIYDKKVNKSDSCPSFKKFEYLTPTIKKTHRVSRKSCQI